MFSSSAIMAAESLLFVLEKNKEAAKAPSVRSIGDDLRSASCSQKTELTCGATIVRA